FYSYRARRGHARGALYGSGSRQPRLEALRPHWLDARHPAVQRHHRRLVGLLSLSRRCRPAGRNQFALADLRHLESIACGRGARGCHHHPDENGPAPLDLGDAATHGLARHYYHDRELPENLRCESLHRVSCDASGGAFANGAEMRPTKAIFVRKPGSLLRVARSHRPSSTSSSSNAVIPALTAAAKTLFLPMPSASHIIGPTRSF